MSFMSEKEEMTLKSYAKIAETRNITHGDFDFWRKDFDEFRKFLPKGRIIDIGCGAGRDALLFKECKEFYSYIGIDASPEMIREARRMVVGTIFLEMNMYELNFGKDFFDGFWASVSLLHISKSRSLGVFQRKINVVLGQIRKIVKKNGIGFIVIKQGEGEKMIYDEKGNGRFFVFYNDCEFRKILEKNKFKVLKCRWDLKNYHQSEDCTIYLKYFVKNMKK